MIGNRNYINLTTRIKFEIADTVIYNLTQLAQYVNYVTYLWIALPFLIVSI